MQVGVSRASITRQQFVHSSTKIDCIDSGWIIDLKP